MAGIPAHNLRHHAPVVACRRRLQPVEGFDGGADDSQLWATTAYVRIARSAILFPVYISVFWLVFHRMFAMAHLIIGRKS